ncbi:MAG: ERF family protein [Verrucomicrobiales bacterium]|nr:ERF family protein [Verrucomicrobiales bacterium]
MIEKSNGADEASTEAQSVLAVIARAATDDSVDMEKMEQLLLLQERILDKRAVQEANRALYTFQSLCPPLEKNCSGGNFRFCSHESMMTKVRPLMERCGFCERFDTGVDTSGNICSVVCTVVHCLGHSWTSTFPVKTDRTGQKNEIQGTGSALSYGKRYSFAAAMGIVFKDVDAYGRQLHHGPPKKMVAKIPDWQQSTSVRIEGPGK